MQTWKFKALVLCNEININNIALHFGINKKLKWEDALFLSENLLTGILRDVTGKAVYIYHFGTLVFINMEYHELQDVIKYLKNIDQNLKNNNPTQFSDEYSLEVSPDHEYALYNDLMTTNEYNPYQQDILALVLAKSTSLRKIEADIDTLFDSIENIINYLDSGKFNMSDEDIAKTSAKILRHKYNTISYLMLLDKPKSAWNNEDIESFFDQMLSLFDLNDRYEKLKHKTEVLKDVTEVFSTLSHEKRGTRLEIMVIALIAFEIIISLVEKAFNFL